METSAAPALEDSHLASHAQLPGRGRAKPEEVQASLEAVRVAQETARARARRETQRARVIVVSMIAAFGMVAWSISSRRKHHAQQAIAATMVAPAPVVAPPPPVQPAAAAQPAPVVAATPHVPAAISDVAACNLAFAERRWPTVATACAAAFKVRPQESGIAMRVAQAQHRRGQIADAGQWARSAIALDPDIAEAYPILARAEGRAGHPAAAATAYRRYLALAPHGWHSAEARAALARWEGGRAGGADAR